MNNEKYTTRPKQPQISNRPIVETGAKLTPLAHIYMTAYCPCFLHLFGNLNFICGGGRGRGGAINQ